MKIGKILIGICIMLIFIGAVYAATPNDFKAPSNLKPIGTNAFVDGNGHNIDFCSYEDNKGIWFENDTGYIVGPYSKNATFFAYVDESDVDPDGIEGVGVLEVVEVNGEKLIINSWTPNDNEGIDDTYNALLEFNKLNNLKPLDVDSVT